MSIENVTVIGAGLMGKQIAMQVAINGYSVTCYDVSQNAIKEATKFSESWFATRVQKNKMDQVEVDEIQTRLRFITDEKEAAKDADIVMEAVLDMENVKRSVLKSFDKFTKKGVIYTSNSSYIVSSRFADAVKDPTRILNVHFFNPALVMKIVEVVNNERVSQETFDVVFDFIKSINKTPVRIEKEIYGFVVNRIFSALTREACNLVDLGIASPEDIDNAVKGALGHSMGPLETLDMTGIDLEYNVYMERFRNSNEKKDLPAACLTEHYAKGEYGRKTKKGFYKY